MERSIMVKKRGLGKSLDALLVGSGTEAILAGREEERLHHLPLESIESGRYQPRQQMDAEGLEDLASSIRAQGVIQPIVVRRLEGGRHEIIAGERRWRASRLAGLKTIPALVRDI